MSPGSEISAAPESLIISSLIIHNFNWSPKPSVSRNSSTRLTLTLPWPQWGRHPSNAVLCSYCIVTTPFWITTFWQSWWGPRFSASNGATESASARHCRDLFEADADADTYFKVFGRIYKFPDLKEPVIYTTTMRKACGWQLGICLRKVLWSHLKHVLWDGPSAELRSSNA